MNIKQIEKKVKEIQKIMKLEHIQLILRETKDDSLHAKVITYVKRNKAEIEFNLELNADEGELLDTIFHELLHVHQADQRDLIDGLIGKLDSKIASDIIEQQFITLNERYTDMIARILTDLYKKNYGR